MLEDLSVPARFARIVASLPPDGSVLDRYCEAGQLLLDGTGASFIVDDARRDRHTVTVTSALALMIAEAQRLTGEGPGLDARRSGDVVHGDLGALSPSRWPRLRNVVCESGFAGSILALPIGLFGQDLGVLVVHRLQPFSTIDRDSAGFLALCWGAALVQQLSPEGLDRELCVGWGRRRGDADARG